MSTLVARQVPPQRADSDDSGILMSIAYLAMTIVDYRRRDKKFWVYRLVRRP